MSNTINSASTYDIFNDHSKPVMVVGDKYGFVDDYDTALAKWEDYAKKYSSTNDVYPLQADENVLHGFGFKDGMYKLSQVEPVDNIDALFDALIAKDKEYYEGKKIEFTCTNGANSSLKVQAVNVDDALTQAKSLFDSGADYISPINVESECGLVGGSFDGAEIPKPNYTAEELGLNDNV